MATILVRQDGSGASTTIQGGIVLAAPGDTIDIGPGTYNENIDLYRDNLVLNGAGRTATIVAGVQEVSVTCVATFALGATVLTVSSGLSNMKAGRLISGTGIPTNARIVSIGAGTITISAATTSARTNQTITMAIINGGINQNCTLRMRSNGSTVKNMKLIGVLASAVVKKTTDNGTIWLPVSGNGSSAAGNYIIEDCEIQANGDSAIIGDNTGVGGGTIRNNIISGQGFVGAQPTQVHGFSTVAVTANILSLTTIEIPAENLVDVGVGSPILAVTGLVAASTTVASISGNVLTLNKSLLGGVGTAQTITFTNIQFNIPNVARQIVVIGANNGSVVFTGNTVTPVTGGGISYNTAVTIDSVGSTITNNTFNGNFGAAGYAVRVRGSNSIVTGNTNITYAYANLGYYFLPNGVTGVNYALDAMILYSGKYYKCILAHTSATNTLPTGVDGATYWLEITLNDVNASGVYGVAVQDIANNIAVDKPMLVSAQPNAGDPVTIDVTRYWITQSAKVQASSTFSNQANWNILGVVYKQSGGALRFTPGYRTGVDVRTVALKTGMLSAQTYQFHKIILSTPSNELLVIYRSDVASPSAFDFVLK